MIIRYATIFSFLFVLFFGVFDSAGATVVGNKILDTYLNGTMNVAKSIYDNADSVTSPESYQSYAGFSFYATTTLYVGGVGVFIQDVCQLWACTANTDLMMWVWQGTTTDHEVKHYNELVLVDNSLPYTDDYISYLDVSTIEDYEVIFEFTDQLYLEAGNSYTFLVRPTFYEDNSWFYLWNTDEDFSFTETLTYWVENTDTPSNVEKWFVDYRGGSFRFYDYVYPDADAPVTLTEPCVTTSFSNVRCVVGWTATSSILDISGTSTPIMSWIGGQYGLYFILEDNFGNVVESKSYTLPDYEATAFYNYFTGIGQIFNLIDGDVVIGKVCQGGVDGNFTTDAYGACAEFVLGFGLSTASTTEQAQLRGMIPKPVTNLPWNSITTGTSTTTVYCFSEFQVICDVWENIKYGFPYGYVVYVWEAWNVFDATTTDYDFVIGLDLSDFNSGSGTALIDFDRDINITDMANATITVGAVNVHNRVYGIIESFLWAFFGLFLVKRIVSGVYTDGLDVAGSSVKGAISRRRYDEVMRSKGYKRIK